MSDINKPSGSGKRPNPGSDNRIRPPDGGDRKVSSSHSRSGEPIFTGDASVPLQSGSPMAMVRDLASQTLAKTDMAPTTSPSQPRDTSPEPSEEQASKRRRTDATTSSQPAMVEMPQGADKGKGKDRADTQDQSSEKLERDARAALPKYGDITPVLNTAQRLRDTKQRTPARVPEHISLTDINQFIKDISTIDKFKRNQNIDRSEVKKAMERVQNCDEFLKYKSSKTVELVRTIEENPQIQAFLSSGE